MKLVISFSLLFVGSVLSLVLNWARLGSSEGQAWSLIHQCPVCFDVSKLMTPIMAVDGASKTALHLVSFSFVLSLVAMTLVLLDKPKSYVEMVLGLGGVTLALAPVVFSMSIPNQFPVQLERGSYAAMLFGTMTAVGAFVSVYSAKQAQNSSQEDVRDGFAQAVQEGKRLVGSPRSPNADLTPPSPTSSSYGTSNVTV